MLCCGSTYYCDLTFPAVNAVIDFGCVIVSVWYMYLRNYQSQFSFSCAGRRQVAQAVIKDHFGHVTPNRVL